jgi:acetolactate synthase-1/3 small subunit
MARATTTRTKSRKPAAQGKNLAQVQPPASAYFIEERHDAIESHTLSVVVDNAPGVLARVVGLFSGRGYNIDSLTVSETEHAKHLSRITIKTTGTRMVIGQIRNQLERLVPVHSVNDLTVEGWPLERELVLIKVSSTGKTRFEALQLAEAFKAEVVVATTEHFIFQMASRPDKIDQFVAVMSPLGLVELCRTGVAAIGRGATAMTASK